jgi:hypothetical protein
MTGVGSIRGQTGRFPFRYLSANIRLKRLATNRMSVTIDYPTRIIILSPGCLYGTEGSLFQPPSSKRLNNHASTPTTKQGFRHSNLLHLKDLFTPIPEYYPIVTKRFERRALRSSG